MIDKLILYDILMKIVKDKRIMVKIYQEITKTRSKMKNVI